MLGIVLRTAHADPRPMIEQPSAFETLAVQAAEQWSRERNRPVQIDVLGTWASGAPLPARYHWSWTIKDQSAEARSMTVRFTREGGSGSEPGPEVRLRLRDMAPTWVLRASLQAGQPLGCESLEERLLPVPVGHGVRWRGPCEALAGRQARRPLTPGAILMAGDVRLPPAVPRLTTVLLKSAQGPIEIEVSALALHDADVGQRVPVRPHGTHQSVVALVVAPGTVVLK